jgi:hypothetical protein
MTKDDLPVMVYKTEIMPMPFRQYAIQVGQFWQYAIQ